MAKMKVDILPRSKNTTMIENERVEEEEPAVIKTI